MATTFVSLSEAKNSISAKQTQRKTSKFRITGPLWGNPSAIVGFPNNGSLLQKAFLCMSWRIQASCIFQMRWNATRSISSCVTLGAAYRKTSVVTDITTVGQGIRVMSIIVQVGSPETKMAQHYTRCSNTTKTHLHLRSSLCDTVSPTNEFSWFLNFMDENKQAFPIPRYSLGRCHLL